MYTPLSGKKFVVISDHGGPRPFVLMIISEIRTHHFVLWILTDYDT
jgi:hypothetical protein